MLIWKNLKKWQIILALIVTLGGASTVVWGVITAIGSQIVTASELKDANDKIENLKVQANDKIENLKVQVVMLDLRVDIKIVEDKLDKLKVRNRELLSEYEKVENMPKKVKEEYWKNEDDIGKFEKKLEKLLEKI